MGPAVSIALQVIVVLLFAIGIAAFAGLVKGSPDPADGRQTILSLTDACRKMVKANRAAKEDWLFRAIRTKLSSAEQEKLAAALELVKRIAGE